MEVRPGYKQTAVGVIPEEWDVATLSSLIGSLEAGVSVNSVEKDKAIFAHDESILKTSCVHSGKFIPEEHKQILPSDIHRAKLNPRKDSIIFSRMNTPALVGECGYVDRDYPNLFMPDRLWMTRLDGPYFSCARWLAYLLSFGSFNRAIKDTATGTSGSMKNISKSSLLSVQVPLPTKAEQEAIANALSDTDALIESLEQLIAKKRQIKQGAMQELFTAKKRLPGFSGGWLTVCMREILAQNATYGIVTAGTFVRNGVKMLRGGDIVDGRVNTDLPMVSNEKAAEYIRTTLVKNDVVIALVGYPGATAKIPDELIGANISRAVGLLRLNSKVSPDYLVCFLNSPNGRRMVLAPSAGSAQQVVNLAALNKLEFSLPKSEEQTAIANILSDMDAEIAVPSWIPSSPKPANLNGG